MKKNYRIFIAVLSLFCSSNLFAQQDPIYSQYLFNPLLYNPAYASVYEMSSITTQTKVQWLGSPTFALTNALSAFSSTQKMGVGLNLLNDRVGLEGGKAAYRNTQADLIYSYKISLQEGIYLSAGLQTSFINKRMDNQNLNLKYEEDPLFQTPVAASKINFGTGLYLLNEEKYYLGFSIPRILNSTYQEGEVIGQRYNRHYYISGGLMLGSEGNIPIRPSFVLRTAKGISPAIDLTTTILLSDIIWAGVTVRNFNSLAILGQLDISEKFRIAYAMDLPVSNNAFRNFATHELSLNINFAALKEQTVIYPRYF
jgi:type IX secretion system PorP/SprF family membrane protein